MDLPHCLMEQPNALEGIAFQFSKGAANLQDASEFIVHREISKKKKGGGNYLVFSNCEKS